MRCPFLGRVMTALFPNVGFVSKSRRTHWVVKRPARMRTVEKRATSGCPFGESRRESCIPLFRTRSNAATILFTGGVLFRRRAELLLRFFRLLFRMSYERLPGNIEYARKGRFGRIMNKFSPLRHEPNRRERLMEAIMNDDQDEAVRLIKETGMKGSDFDQYLKGFLPLNTAIRKNQVRVVKALCEAGARGSSQEVPDPVHGTFFEGPLSIAVSLGYIDIVRVLIAFKFPFREWGGGTTLCIASSKGYIDIVRLLLAAGDGGTGEKYQRCGHYRGWRNKSPIELAEENGHHDIVELLLEAKPSERNNDPDNESNRGYGRARGGRKRTRKHRKSNRRTRSSRKSNL